MLWRRRKPRSKFTATSANNAVDEGEHGILVDVDSESEDDEEEPGEQSLQKGIYICIWSSSRYFTVCQVFLLSEL